MAENETRALKSINQVRHFNFDPTVLSNKVFNIFMQQWDKIVRGSLITHMQKLKDLSEKDQKKLRNLWRNRIFQCGKTNMILEKFTKTIDDKVLAIPSNFVLPKDEENAHIANDEATEEIALLDKIKAKRVQIIQLRIQIETLRKLKDAR